MKERFLSLLLFFFISSMAVFSQNTATVNSFVLTTDHIQSADRRNDLNGNPCALVKVQVLDDIERIEGNKIGDIITRGVEKWVYMCKGSRNMRIHLKNHLPLRVNFRDYKINGLEGNRVYELVVNVPKKISESVEVKGNYLQMRVSPINAMVSIWGDNYQKQVFRPQDDGTIRVYLPYGPYYYSAKVSGYNDIERKVFITDEDKWEEVTMEKTMGRLSIECATPKVDFYLDGKKLSKGKNVSSWNGELLPGEYSVKAVRKGYIEETQNAVVKANESTIITFNNLLSISDKKKRDAIELKQQENKQIKKETVTTEKKYDNKGLNKSTDFNSKPLQSSYKPKLQNRSTVTNNPLTFGVRVGVNLSSLGLDDKADGHCSMVTSFHVGVCADIRLMDDLYINTSLLFSKKGYKYEHEKVYDRKETVSAQFITIPVQLSYRLGLIQLNLGPYVEYGVGGKIKSYGRSVDTFSYYDAFNYGLIVGAGVNLMQHFYFGGNYEVGMGDYSNRNIAISIGYNF